ncbi:MAG: phosphoribosylaminoimidazolesuccinocarboxamide synthase [Blastocatellia bacterium]|nr:phosphoribosylaminoimidazolesuccinocarboxamide synthase [Blastocatellia bacterium]MCS7158042.1 phosphoribosylaminoimidazolesuccinocarboxamide synthase [Blastocatellia bacterium]MCX7752549.1 phosphoribosylaminoimidazolesuccinocarboxamide synthase [Blastocatellia bacterium]MDW8167335.1 phosphoribosylaminoimidazolesuccinocarboxamide synthase [Acidobacteriota bacterium]MDW8257339.1 phosphoribosylaminoimidazolesuccinocarboxamide synthase [Acidobacteriota bacterium]
MSFPSVVWETNLTAYPLLRRGKVRDIYAVGDDRLLIVTTDRISAFDVVLPDGIPGKGAVLTQLSAFWFRQLASLTPHHLITTDVQALDELTETERTTLRSRSMLVYRAHPIPIECVVRGYLAGSAWREYQQSRTVGGLRLPPGFVEGERLPEPIFTPAIKATEGHDVNISEAEMADRIGTELTHRLKELSLALYMRASEYALARGLILADTKFEFGWRDQTLLWIDEALTPDSSRFWAADQYAPGRPQPSFDKQFLRDYLESIGWDKKPPAPHLPESIITQTAQRYLMAYHLLTGEDLTP